MKDYTKKYLNQSFFSKKHLANLGYDWVLLTIVTIICGLGLAFLASTLSVQNQRDFHQDFIKQLIFGIWIGAVACYIFARLDYKKIFKSKNTLLFITFGMLGFLAVFAAIINVRNLSPVSAIYFIDQFSNLPISPHIANGSVRWIDLRVIVIQPSEVAKLTLLIYFCAFLYNFRDKKIGILDLKRPLYAFIVTSILIYVQPDLGSVLLLFIILFSVMVVGKINSKIIGVLTLLVLVFGLVSSLITPYRRQRVLAVLNPTSSDAETYQIDQVRNAISNGGLWGQGYGHSSSKQQNLILESSTDSIIAVIAEEMGFVFVAIFVALYLFLFLRGLKIAKNAPDIGGKALAVGISVWIASQAFLNIAGNLGLVPLKGLPLPFVSAGNSSIVLNLTGVGILLNISSQSYGKISGKDLPRKSTFKSKVKPTKIIKIA
jgi:cell division protein FtsW